MWAVGFIGSLGGVFGNARLHKLLHESGGKRFVGRKSNRAFSEIISGKLVLVCPDGVSTGIEGAMVLRSAERNQQPRSEAVAWDVVADALFGGGRRGFDVSTKLLKRGSLRDAHARKVVINRFRLGRHDFLCERIAAESQVSRPGRYGDGSHKRPGRGLRTFPSGCLHPALFLQAAAFRIRRLSLYSLFIANTYLHGANHMS